ncbi:hypothetical protein PL321_06915 [Caloramator sp. mosi_1]|uniref:hypothetical protein n=1 Tax=Caloramator sp. mosi_1 TaxID=3023090 RepID=UPI00235E5537|nr:hypothetical protein [Caloramator sp. mosi_1]WDC85192.1 hypothetical protein PL321_06915 [Caloramator sp. mosi_1]
MTLYHIDLTLRNTIDDIAKEIIDNNFDVIEIDGICNSCDKNLVFECFDSNPIFNILRELQLQGIRGYRFDCNIYNNSDRKITLVKNTMLLI